MLLKVSIPHPDWARSLFPKVVLFVHIRECLAMDLQPEPPEIPFHIGSELEVARVVARGGDRISIRLAANVGSHRCQLTGKCSKPVEGEGVAP
jgi:hypothetical protein